MRRPENPLTTSVGRLAAWEGGGGKVAGPWRSRWWSEESKRGSRAKAGTGKTSAGRGKRGDVCDVHDFEARAPTLVTESG